jgi:hypothetical protein
MKRFEIGLIVLASLFQVSGTVAMAVWEIIRFRRLGELGVASSFDLAGKWLLASTVVLLIATSLIAWQKQIKPISTALLFLSLICHVSIYVLSYSSKQALLSFFPTSETVEGLVSTGVLSEYAIGGPIHDGAQWSFWLWASTFLISTALLLKILSCLFGKSSLK